MEFAIQWQSKIEWGSRFHLRNTTMRITGDWVIDFAFEDFKCLLMAEWSNESRWRKRSDDLNYLYTGAVEDESVRTTYDLRLILSRSQSKLGESKHTTYDLGVYFEGQMLILFDSRHNELKMWPT